MAYYRWPKSCNGIDKLDEDAFNMELPPHAIILTGLLKLEDDFTVETVRLYRRLYPKAMIIISTWNTEDATTLKRLSEIKGVYVVLSKEPDYPGVNHVNNQIKTASKGIAKAKELGAEYVLRTRSDVRIYRKNILDFLYLSLRHYTSGNDDRILTMSGRFGTMHIWYVLCDFLVYGALEETKNLYAVPYDGRILTPEEKEYSYKKKTRMLMTPESWLFKNYLDLKYGKECYGFDRKDYYAAVRDRFIVLDEDLFQAYWYKHDYRFDWTRGRSYKDENGENFDFILWRIMNDKNV